MATPKTPYKQREGKIFFKDSPEYQEQTEEEFSKKLLEIEQYLNGEVAEKIWRKHRIALRVHL